MSTSQPSRAPDAAPLVRIRGLEKRFGEVEVLRGIDLDISRGEVVAIIGPSGSGKSTLLRCINRLETPTAGVVEINGVALSDKRKDLARMRRSVGMVFQHFNLFQHMTAEQNVMEGPVTVLRRPREQARAAARELLDRVGLRHKAEARPSALSGGERQRVGIARALAMQPDLVLFDEVTSALDPERVAEVLRVVRDLADDGMTMAIVTHEMSFARRVSSRVLFLDHGRIVEDARPEEVFGASNHPRVRQFLDQLEWETDPS